MKIIEKRIPAAVLVFCLLCGSVPVYAGQTQDEIRIEAQAEVHTETQTEVHTEVQTGVHTEAQAEALTETQTETQDKRTETELPEPDSSDQTLNDSPAVRIICLESTAGGLYLSWEETEDADSYFIYRKSGDDVYACIAGIGSGKHEYTDSCIIPGIEYRYYVQAYDQETRSFGKENPEGTAAVWLVEPREIAAGTVLTAEAVDCMGTDAFFYTEEISDETFARMWGKSFKEYCTTPREDLRYIGCLHKDINGLIKKGELVMHRTVADTVCGIFRELYEAGYPVQSMLLVDEFDASDEASIMVNNTSAFNFRNVDNTDQLSMHAYGLAIDINPYYNVYYIPSAGYVFPPEGWAYTDREADFPYKLEAGDLCYQLFTEAGFEWGGWWTQTLDYQHFQYPLS